MILLRFIYWIFEKQFNKIVFSKQRKKKGFDEMQKVFVDSNGMSYYTWQDDFNMPIARFKEVQKHLMKIKSGLSDENINKIITAMKEAINRGKNPDIAKIGFLITEIENRQEVVIDPDTLLELCTLTFIREDEDASIVNEVIHKEKVEQFKKDSAGGLYDFFYQAGIYQYVPFMKKSQEEWNEYLEQCRIKIEALNKFLESTTKQK